MSVREVGGVMSGWLDISGCNLFRRRADSAEIIHVLENIQQMLVANFDIVLSRAHCLLFALTVLFLRRKMYS